MKMAPPARRVFRLSLTVSLSLAAGYAMNLPLPFIPPLLALFLGAKPGPPLPLKALAGLMVLLIVTLGFGLFLVPILSHYPATGLMLVITGLFLSNYLSAIKGKKLVGTFLTVGLTMITAAGVASFALATLVVKSLLVSILVAVACQWLVQALLPEEPLAKPPPAPPPAGTGESSWLAVQATIIVFPAYLMALINPAAYMPLIMKSAALGQQGSIHGARREGRELLGSTCLAGVLAILFWFALDLVTNLWMFFLWTALFTLYPACKLYGILSTRLTPTFWINVLATMLILLGPAVQDSSNGKDVYKAFAVRISLFLAVTLYSWMSIVLIETWRVWRGNRQTVTIPNNKELTTC